MTLLSKIDNDIKESMKSKQSKVVQILRNLKSAITNASLTPTGKKEMDDSEVVKVLRKQAKQREDSIAAFQNSNRTDLIEIEKEELNIINSYLPKSLSNDQIEIIVQESIKELNDTTIKDMGKVMKLAAEKANGQVDNKTLSEKIKTFLK